MFSNRNELNRRNHAAFGMMPAQQRLAAGDLLGFDVDNGLIVKLEFAIHDRFAQIQFERASRLHARVHFGFEKAVVAPTVGLGAVKRQVRALQSWSGLSPSVGAMAIPTLAPTFT